MALNAYLKLKGARQGDIKGSVTQKGRENSILIVATDHLILSPRDAATGQATGKRQHQPIVFTKEIDAATPLLHEAMVSNEIIREAGLDFWRPEATGREVLFYRVLLTDAYITSIKLEMLNTQYPENVRIPVREKIALVYRKISWIWTDGGVTAEDDWESPVI
jgi:type VI secretion system secreted protein Hcp